MQNLAKKKDKTRFLNEAHKTFIFNALVQGYNRYRIWQMIQSDKAADEYGFTVIMPNVSTVYRQCDRIKTERADDLRAAQEAYFGEFTEERLANKRNRLKELGRVVDSANATNGEKIQALREARHEVEGPDANRRGENNTTVNVNIQQEITIEEKRHKNQRHGLEKLGYTVDMDRL